ncbi:hypothetical protein YC2023_042025 [Brassica napus]
MSTEIVSSFGNTRFSFQGRNARSLIRKIEIFLVLFESLTESGWGSTPSSSSSTALLCLKELYLLLDYCGHSSKLWLILQTQSTISTKRSRLSSTSSPSTISASARTSESQSRRSRLYIDNNDECVCCSDSVNFQGTCTKKIMYMGHAPAAGNYDDSLESRREVLKQENPETVQENQYTYAHSEPEYAKQQQLNTAYDASQTNAQNQMQNLASLSNVDVLNQQGYPHSDPNSLLAQTAQNARELDLQYSAFAQSVQSRNSENPSLGGQSISMPEALRGSGIPGTQPMQQNLQGANIATGPALPQQLPQMHPYSRLTMPLSHFANMISYPLMPQNYPYMPSAFQQTYAGNSSYHQQLAALLPQYKTNLSPSSLPQSATAPASAYGFENSTNVGSAGNFPLSQQSAPTGYDDVLSSQYKESNHLLALQHQQQQFQTEMSLERQQQNPRDGAGAQVGQQPSDQTQQLWQNSY